ncbi:uncharacterized protein LOC118513193 [Anopheles stephensi]|uniref:uncharacterized protein LOC118513193 n=1 Tax=Anopheles stephensi TaxID=30069 RepID=UPI001658C1C5|nr:uncharacterized protein LOC118513193 [Anopheles stephensi]
MCCKSERACLQLTMRDERWGEITYGRKHNIFLAPKSMAIKFARSQQDFGGRSCSSIAVVSAKYARYRTTSKDIGWWIGHGNGDGCLRMRQGRCARCVGYAARCLCTGYLYKRGIEPIDAISSSISTARDNRVELQTRFVDNWQD